MVLKSKIMTSSRSAVTYKYVTATKAKRNPKKTVTETTTPYNRHRRAVLLFIKRMTVVTLAITARKQASLLLKKLKAK